MKRCSAVVVSVSLVLLWCPPASAQSQTESPNATKVADLGLRIPMVVWATSVAADQMTTYRFASGYHDLLHEENVLIRGLDAHPLWLVAAGSTIDAATGWLAYRFVGKTHPRLAAMAFYGAAAYRTYLTAHNLRMIRQAEALRAANQ